MPFDNPRMRDNYVGTNEAKSDDEPPHLLGPAFHRDSDVEEGNSSDACAAMPKNNIAPRRKLSNANEDDGSYYYFMSEPSLSVSEDGSRSSHNHEHHPLSPANGGQIHMPTSPSNTSVSSLGSPGASRKSITRKRLKQYPESKTHNMISLLGPLEGISSSGEGDAIFDADGKEIGKSLMLPDVGRKKVDGVSDLNGTGIVTIAENEILGSDLKGSDTMDDLSVGSSNSSIGPENSTELPKNGKSLVRSTPVTIRNSADSKNEESFESQNYHTAEESCNEDNTETNNDSDLSYDEQSGDEEKKIGAQVKNKEKESSSGTHFLNKPTESPTKKTKSRHKSIGDDKDILLRNTDASPMDISPLDQIPNWNGSPESMVDSVELVASPALSDDESKGFRMHLTTPPRISPFQYPQEEEDDEEDETTPKRKTSQPPSLDNSPLSNSDLGQVLEELASAEEKTGGDALFTKTDEDGKKSRKKRNGTNDKRGPGHRRTRSGDGAAATLLTGSSEWIGMELDNLPLPNQREADEDDISKEDINIGKDSSQKRRSRRRSGSASSGVWVPINAISADNLTALEEGNISTRFSPRIAGDTVGENTYESYRIPTDGGHKPLQRSHSFGDYSVSTTESHFSWISKNTSLAHGERSSVMSAGELFSGNEGSTQSMNRSHSPNPLASLKTPPSANLHHPSHTAIDNSQVQKTSSFDAHIRAITRNPSHSIRSKLPLIESDTLKDYPTFTCPKCKTVQREFFTVTSAAKEFEGSTGYLVIYFVLYMVLSLFIFGIEEGWPPLDCVYFSVNTLTITGFGDYVPTADAAKIICAIFIYFGVAVIGLLLGSMHANSLDDAAKKTAKENMINNCPTCFRIQNMKNSPRRRNLPTRRVGPTTRKASNIQKETVPLLYNKRSESSADSNFTNMKTSGLHTIDESNLSSRSAKSWLESTRSPGSMLSLGSSPGSDAPAEVMNRQSHTRHYSLDSPGIKNVFDPGYSNLNRTRLDSEMTERRANHDMLSPHNDMFMDDPISDIEDEGNDSDGSSLGWSTLSHDSEDGDIFRPVSKIKAAKYVFLTLKQAIANSLFVIVIGSVGFYYIENMTAVDAFYFTTVLLTSVGYGDIVPVTPEGKLFCTLYALVAMSAILHNISRISMIPLELRKRRVERAVLMQFGDELDDAALKELATGPLVQRLQITENSPEGLGQCTREMFALAMLVRLGRITEQDVRSTFAAFKRLDRDNDGLLTSKEIILSAVERKKREQKLAIGKSENLLSSPGGVMMQRNQQLNGDERRNDIRLDREKMPLMSNHSNGISYGVHPLSSKTAQNYMSVENGGQSHEQADRPRVGSIGSAVSALTYDEGGSKNDLRRNQWQ